MNSSGDDRIWIDWVATRFGFGRLASALPGSPAPAYVFIGCFVTIDIAIRIYQTVTGIRPILVNNPLWLAQEVALVGAVVAAKWIHNEYRWVLDRMAIDDRVSDPGRFKKLAPERFLWLGFVLGAAGWWAFALFVVTPAEAMQVGGPLALVTGLVIIPFVYVPVAIEFLTAYLGVVVLFPRRIIQSGLKPYFPDPERVGGFRPVGELIKSAYYLLMIGLVVFALRAYLPHITGVFASEGDPPGVIYNLIFTSIWVVSIITVAYGILVLHLFLRREKRETLKNLDEQVRDHYDAPWEIHEFREPTDITEYERLRQRIEYVKQTKEYPGTFSMWSQLLLGLVIPKAVQLLLAQL